MLDSIEALTFVAAYTQRVGLGTSVLNIPFYNPVTLGRRLTTLDILSKERLRAGFGLDWSADEFEAAGANQKERGARADEFLAALKTTWGAGPVEFHGKYFTVPRSVIGAKPVQKPHPPIYLGLLHPPCLSAPQPWPIAGCPMASRLRAWRRLARNCARWPKTLGAIHKH